MSIYTYVSTIIAFPFSHPKTLRFSIMKRVLKDEVDDYLYIGEGIIHEDFRQNGLFQIMLHQNEQYARELGFVKTTFMTVDRDEDHPARPATYRPLDKLWRYNGYQKLETKKTVIPWKCSISQQQEENTLTFWSKAL